MSRYIITCWKCGHKYDLLFDENVTMFHPACPKCGTKAEDSKKSVRIGKTVGKWMMGGGIVTAIFSLWGLPLLFGAVPSIKFLFLGIGVAILGFFVKAFATP